MGYTTQHQSDDLSHPCPNGFSQRIELFNRCPEVRWRPLTQIDRNPRPIRRKKMNSRQNADLVTGNLAEWTPGNQIWFSWNFGMWLGFEICVFTLEMNRKPQIWSLENWEVLSVSRLESKIEWMAGLLDKTQETINSPPPMFLQGPNHWAWRISTELN